MACVLFAPLWHLLLPSFFNNSSCLLVSPPEIPPSSTPPLPFAGVSFPGEIVDRIIDHLHDERSALLVCCLVERLWVPSARYHLFGRLSLTPKDVAELLPVIAGPYNTLSPFVKHLVLSGSGTSGTSHYQSIECKQCKDYMSNATHAGAYPCPAKVVTVHQIQSLSTYCRTWRKVIASFQHIQHLDLVRLEFDEFADFMELVDEFPLLETLYFDLVRWQPIGPVYERSKSYRRLHKAPKLRLLDLCDQNTIDIKNWLFAQASIPIIEALHFDTHKHASNDAIKRLMVASQHSIKEVKLEMNLANESRGTFYNNSTPPSVPPEAYLAFHLDDFDNSIDLSVCKNLRHLHLHNIILISGFVMTSRIPRWVPNVLSQVVSAKLEEVVLTILVHRDADLNCLDWNSIDDILSGSRFSSLKTVRIRIPGSDPIKFDRALVAQDIRDKRLPSLFGNNTLTLEFPGSLGTY